MKLLYSIVGLLFITALILEGVNIYLSNKISTDSIIASKLQARIDNADEQISALNSEVLKYSSYQVVSNRAMALGFQVTRNYISLYSPLQVAVSK